MTGAATSALSQDEAFARIRLLRSPNIGPVSYALLLQRFETAAAALEALPDLGKRGGRSYRATIKISDPALDARSLKLSLQGSGGAAVAPGTARAVEDAILTRARQLRIQDGRL